MESSSRAEDRGLEGALLLRRIKRDWTRRDESGRLRVKSIAFQDRNESGAMSVARSDVLASEGRPLTDALKGWEGYGLVAIPAAVFDQLGLEVRPDPKPDDSSHALVFGKKTGSIKKRLVDASEWIVETPGV
jgi:hypothetical protein